MSDVMSMPDLRRFLLAFFIYIDGVNTAITFSAIFAAKTLGFQEKELLYLFLVVQLSALVGALSMARPTDSWGPRKVISMTLLLWTGVTIASYFIVSKMGFLVIAVLAGLGLGVVQAASRALMSSLVPQGKEAEMFGFYAFCGKSSSVIGPLVFGGISYGLGGDQRTAILSVSVFFILGFILLQRVGRPGETVAQRPQG
jgi:UMF1 family MFS transporter